MLNPSITQIFDKPKQQVALNQFGNTTGAERRQTHLSTMTTTQSNVPSLNTMPPFSCYGCGSHQHTLCNCQPTQDLLCRGLLVHDQQRHITLPHNKGPLQCEGGETLLDMYTELLRDVRSPLYRRMENYLMMVKLTRMKMKRLTMNIHC